jgi:hypothetical protein
LLHGFPGQIYKHRGFVKTDTVNRAGWYLDLFAGKPMAGFDDQLTNRPTLGVHHKIAEMTDLSIASLDTVTAYGLRASQMCIGMLGGVRVIRSSCIARERFRWLSRYRKATHTP